MWWAIAILWAACGGTDIDLPQPADLEAVASTEGQSAPAGARLPAPLAVIVRAADGAPVPRGEVEWTVSAGDGASLSDGSTIADGTGRAEVTLTLGSTPGPYGVRAALAVNQQRAVEFTATATNPPQLSAVVPALFTGGDTVTLEGSDLTDAVIADFGTATAQVLSVAGDGQSLAAIVPVCLVPGDVTIRVRVDLATSNSITGTYRASGAPVQLAVGNYASIDPTALSGCATFPDAGPSGAEYLFAPQSVTGSAGRSATFRLRGDSVVTVLPRPRHAPAEIPLAIRFHDFLREREREFAQMPKPRVQPELLAPFAAAAGPALGDRRTFRVCNTLTCSAVEDFDEVLAEVMFVGDHAVIYQDLDAPADGLVEQDFATLGATFDLDLYEVNARAFGAESDVDQNGRLVILMTPVVNQLTPTEECDVAVITGFFFALDVDPAFRDDERSNQAEVFYSLVADPTGSVTCEQSVDRIRRLVPVTFIHEFQHMINYNQHVLRRQGNSEVLWLNEAMSHLAEELGGFHFLDLGDNQTFSRFVIGDLFNAFLYLKDPGAVFALFTDGTGTLEERGAAWLFLRWVVDQFGEGVIRRLAETALNGTANIEAAAGEPIGQLLAQWFLANYVSDLPDFVAPGRLQYTTWAFRTTYASLHGQDPDDFDRPFPLEPNAAQGGTFELFGTLRSGSGEYIRVILDPLQRGFTLAFTDATGGTISSAVAPRLNVIRIR
jgi:hypothetical protein